MKTDDNPEYAKRLNDKKPKLHLIPLVESVAKVFEYGEEKYGKSNWKLGFENEIDQLEGSMTRHTKAILEGEEIDEESGLSHKALRAANALMSAWLEEKVLAKKGKQIVKNGLIKSYYENGKIQSEDNWKDDKLHGVRKWYYSDGNLYQEDNYKDGKLHGVRKSYYSDGNLDLEENYKDGKLHGVRKSYYSDGNLSTEYNWENGKLHGECKDYYEQGNLKMIYNYKDDKLHGVHKFYDGKGNLVREKNYENGELITSTKKN